MSVTISIVISTHNRSELFRRALDGYVWQTLPTKNWEILLVDDMSTEDLSNSYQHLIGQINLRHIKVDHRHNPVWKMRNPNGAAGSFENWYRTPVITNNIGCHLAKGKLIGLCPPEVLHAPQNLEAAVKRLESEKCFLFGRTYVGSALMNAWLDSCSWSSQGWDFFLRDVARSGRIEKFAQDELAVLFLPKKAVEAVGGMDLDYLNGVSGEDDDFKERAMLAGWKPTFAPEIEAFHQDHSNEKEPHRQRTSAFWQQGFSRNHRIFQMRKRETGFPIPANRGFDWTSRECIVSETSYKVGSTKPEEKPILPPSAIMPSPQPAPRPAFSISATSRDGGHIRRVFMATISSENPQNGMEQAFFGVFGRQNVHSFDYMNKHRRAQSAGMINNDFLREITPFHPDWIWLQVQNTNVLTADTLQETRKLFPNAVFSHWMGDMRHEVSPYLASIAKATHLTLASSVGQLPDFLKAGAPRVEYCPIAIDWNDDAQGDSLWSGSPLRSDVVFVGSYYGKMFPGADERVADIRALMASNVEVGVVGRGWEPWAPVIGETKRREQYYAYRNCKVALSINNFNDIERYYSNRMFVALVSGRPVVARYVPGMEKDFVHGEHCFWYKTHAELVHIVQELLHDSALREKVGRAGRALVIRKHTWFARVLDVLPIVEEIAANLRKEI